jgi:hypothetical protein
MDIIVDAFIVYCLPRVEVVQYEHVPCEVVEYPGHKDFFDAVESLGLLTHVWNHFVDGCPEYEDWYHYETFMFEKEVEKKKIDIKHSGRVRMLRDSMNFVDVLKNLEE